MENEKNLAYMIVLLLGIVIIMQVFLIVGLKMQNIQTAVTSAVNQKNTGSIEITATGSASGIPTEGLLTVGVSGRGSTAYAATYNLSKDVSELNATVIKYLNGNLSNIATTSYNLYNQSGNYYTSYNGYVAEEYMSITIPSINNASSVLGSLASVNGISISGLSQKFSSNQLSSLRSVALQRALSNATDQAEGLLPGKTLVARNISVSYYNPIVIPYAFATSAALPSPNPGYFTGSESVTGSVNVVFSYSYN